MTIKIEATPHELEKIETLARTVDTVLDGGSFLSWRDVMSEIQKMLAEAELCEVVPLIKDGKIRKVVRAWAEGRNIESVHYDAFWGGFRRDNSSITVWEELPLEDNKFYTIDELCGEEKE